MMSYLPYPYKSVNISQNVLLALMQHDNIITGGKFGVFSLLTIFGIAFLASKYYESEKALTVASFITMISGWMFVAMELTTGTVAIVPTVLFFMPLLS